MNLDLLTLFVGEIAIILLMYRFLLRKWIIEHWEEKIRSEQGEWLIEILEPAIEEIEIRGKETLEGFMSKFFGSVGKMTAEAKKLDPMNDIRKAAKTGDWMSLAVEYMANKSGIGHLLPQDKPQTTPKQVQVVPKPRQFKP